MESYSSLAAGTYLWNHFMALFCYTFLGRPGEQMSRNFFKERFYMVHQQNGDRLVNI